MNGRKWKLFFFLLSYIGWAFLALSPVCLALGVVAALEGNNSETPVAPTEISMPLMVVLIVGFGVATLLMVFVGIYAAIGKAVFYRDAKAETGVANAEVEASNGSEA